MAKRFDSCVLNDIYTKIHSKYKLIHTCTEFVLW